MSMTMVTALLSGPPWAMAYGSAGLATISPGVFGGSGLSSSSWTSTIRCRQGTPIVPGLRGRGYFGALAGPSSVEP